jgi:site-specific recombinase XerD
MKKIEKRNRKKSHAPRTKLRLPDLDHAKTAVLLSLRSPESQRGYRHAIDEFISWYCSEPRLSFNKIVVTRFRGFLEDRHLASGTINVRLAAVRRLAYEAADAGLLSPELAAGIRRVKGAKKLGVRLGNWLTADEAQSLLRMPAPDTMAGKRDRAILGIMLNCGLRRRELAELTVHHLERRENHWAIVDMIGKGGHIRTVPVPDWVKQAVDEWMAAAGIIDGRLFRCVARTGKVWGSGITETAVWHVVKKYATSLGVPKLAPHDLRRSCARFCHAAGGELEQIQFLLGHVSVQTTERYLGCKQRLWGAVNDRIGIEPLPGI